MGSLFHPRSNTIARVVFLSLIGAPVGLVGFSMIWVRTPFFTGQYDPIEQPVQFDHRHHVGDDGIDCRYCHSGVEKSAFAGVPEPALCMNCHSQIWNKSPKLAPIREAYFSGQPIAWKRVHRVPDFVYFNHAIHVNKGVGCFTCHGRVDTMAAVEQKAPLTMGWCLECHRHPEPNLRPREEITNLTWTSTSDPEVLGRQLVERYHVNTRISCTTCHR